MKQTGKETFLESRERPNLRVSVLQLPMHLLLVKLSVQDGTHILGTYQTRSRFD